MHQDANEGALIVINAPYYRQEQKISCQPVRVTVEADGTTFVTTLPAS